jgi:hypothetical protein
MKTGTIAVEQGKPLVFLEGSKPDESPASTENPSSCMLAALAAHSRAARDLLQGKYSNYAEVVPRHLREKCNITVLRCTDGVFVRYDLPPNGKPFARAAVMHKPLSEIVPVFSDRVIHFGVKADELDPEKDGFRFGWFLHDPSGVVKHGETFGGVILLNHDPEKYDGSKPPGRPLPLFSITNELDIQLEGAVVPAGEPAQIDGPDVQQFLATGKMQLPMGWQAIEIYPLLSDESWNEQNAPLWAEMDILAHAAQRNLQKTLLNALDGRGETRRRYAALLSEFEGLLNGAEEPLHQFLRRHPALISPSHQQIWSKLPFGDRFSDFVFREAHNDYTLVELEAPVRPLFRQDGQQRAELTHAMNQIADWVQYIEDNRKIVEEQLGLVGISTSPRTLIVIGRADSLSEDDRRKVTTLQNQHSKLRILTYDDVLAAARTHLERILGPLSMVLIGDGAQVYYFKPIDQPPGIAVAQQSFK